MAKTPEGRVKDAVKKLLAERGIFYYMPVQNGMGVVGVPDLICCWAGEFLAIETKAPGKKSNTTPNQDRFLDNIRKAGGHTLVVDDAEQVAQYINAYTKANDES